MAALNCETTRCGLCKFYNHEGRRGGYCSQLSAPVNASWNACCLSAAPFMNGPVGSSQSCSGIAEWIAAPKHVSPVIAPIKAEKKASKKVSKKTNKKVAYSAIAS